MNGTREIIVDQSEKEYQTCVGLLKHYATIQFAQLSVFIVVMSGATFFFFGGSAISNRIQFWVRLGAFLMSVCFFIMNASHFYAINRLLHRMNELEADLDYKIIRGIWGIRSWWRRPTSWALIVLSVIFTVFWLAACCG